MIKKNVKIPAIIALSIQGANVFVSLLIVFLQDLLKGPFNYPNALKGIKVFPPSVINSIITLILYAIFFYVINNYSGDRRRGIGIAFFSIAVGISVITFPITTLVQYTYATFMGSEYLAAVSILTSNISLYTFVLSASAAPFYFIAVGRYGISKKED
ncbi:MAG: hypothetical protein K5669_11730 [Lachnospiraceae bacterium]|nr:hypothetical protein [Lachnospiraceae bacterium]